MNAFAIATDILFTDPNLSLEALYRAGGAGAGMLVRVIRRAPDRMANFGEGRFVTESVLIDLRVSEVPDLAEGDTLEIDAVLYEIRSKPLRDSERLIWAAEARSL